jgi:hypothetical protein
VSPRVREDSVHPRLQSGAIVRSLNFTVRPHAPPYRLTKAMRLTIISSSRVLSKLTAHCSPYTKLIS